MVTVGIVFPGGSVQYSVNNEPSGGDTAAVAARPAVLNGMEIKQLRQFLAILRTGSFSRAAVTLGVAQPLLSRQIRSLEEELGTELLYRNGRGVVLTEAGRLLQQHAESIVNSVADAESSIKSLALTPCGEVVLGLPPMIGASLTVPVVESFRKSYPNVNLRIAEAFSGYILEWLTSARLDVAIIYNVAQSAFLSVEPLVEEDLCLVAANRLELPITGVEVRVAELANIPLILPNGLRKLVDGHLARIGAVPRIAFEVDGLSALLRLTEHGLAATIMSGSMARQYRAEARLQVFSIVDPPMRDQLHLATSTQRPAIPVTRALARVVRTEVRALASIKHWTWLPPQGEEPYEA